MTYNAGETTPLSIPGPPVDVILPCLNEAAALPGLLARIPAGYRPVVADNGSTDGSAGIAARYGAVVVNAPQRGFGAAVHAGLLAATSDIVCVMDADGSLDPLDLLAVAGPLLEGTADLMLGRRAPQGAGAWPLHARIGNAVLSGELRRRAGVPLHDLGPMRAFRREELLGLGIADRRFGYPLEMVMRAAAAGWRIAEVSVPYYPRSGGKSKVTGTVRGTIKAVRDMRRVLALCTPDMVEAANAPRVPQQAAPRQAPVGAAR
jgi:glycosyltransferase involved in cell wall biosynthesis